MAQGIRLHHPTRRSEVLLIPHPGDPHAGRQPKTYRIELDSQGDIIVSETIWQRLEEARSKGWPHELVIANPVAEPPRQRINPFGARPTRPIRETRVER